jgi:hypothetical protein
MLGVHTAHGCFVPEHVLENSTTLWLLRPSITVAHGDTRTKSNIQNVKVKDGHFVTRKGEYWLGCNAQGQKILGTFNSLVSLSPGAY